MNPLRVLEKTEKLWETLDAENRLLKRETEINKEAMNLQKKAKKGKEKETYPQGQLFDPEYRAQHEAELAAQKQREKQPRSKGPMLANHQRNAAAQRQKWLQHGLRQLYTKFQRPSMHIGELCFERYERW